MFSFPLKTDFRFTSAYGQRIHPITGKSSGHNGIDLAVPQGTPVHAPARGVIVSSYSGGGGGESVIIEHPGGIRTGYAHLSWRLPKGTKLNKGDIFAKTGNTGNSTGPHLHLTVRKNDVQVDPLSIRWQQPGKLREATGKPVKG